MNVLKALVAIVSVCILHELLSWKITPGYFTWFTKGMFRPFNVTWASTSFCRWEKQTAEVLSSFTFMFQRLLPLKWDNAAAFWEHNLLCHLFCVCVESRWSVGPLRVGGGVVVYIQTVHFDIKNDSPKQRWKHLELYKCAGDKHTHTHTHTDTYIHTYIHTLLTHTYTQRPIHTHTHMWH
jgi:hypothetical protein